MRPVPRSHYDPFMRAGSKQMRPVPRSHYDPFMRTLQVFRMSVWGQLDCKQWIAQAKRLQKGRVRKSKVED